MKYAIIVSKKDLAGMNIKKRLLEEFNFSEKGLFKGSAFYELVIGDNGKIAGSSADKGIGKNKAMGPIGESAFAKNEVRLYTIPVDTVYYDDAESEINADFFVFATRHQSSSGEKTLSVHSPGNFSKAEYGGLNKEVSSCPAWLMKRAFIILNRENDSDYRVSLEATHHGPFIAKPVFFIEIGSLKEQWLDRHAAKIIAKTIIKAITTFNECKCSYKTALGFGGSHYCAGFNKIELRTDIAMSHICPKYSIENLDENMIEKMVKASFPKPDFALLDWKGMNSEQRKKIMLLLENIHLPYMKTKDIEIG